MMNIIDFFKEFEFIKRRRLRSLGGAKICSGGCEYMLRGVRPDRGAPPETALGRGRRHRQNNIKETIHNLTLVNIKFKYKCEYKREKL